MTDLPENRQRIAAGTYLEQKLRFVTSQFDLLEPETRTDDDILHDLNTSRRRVAPAFSQSLSPRQRLERTMVILEVLADDPRVEVLTVFLPDLSQEKQDRFAEIDFTQPADLMADEDKRFLDDIVQQAFSSPGS